MSVDQSGKDVGETGPSNFPTSRRWALCLASGLVGVLVGAGVVGGMWHMSNRDDRPSGPAFTATGTVTVFGSWVGAQEDEGCIGIDDFADLRPGVQVRVFDQAGHELSQGRLGKGIPGKVVGNSCTWPLTVADIPSGASQYRLQVGHREQLAKTAGELRSGVDLSFGAQ